MSVRTTVKSIQDIMRQDSGVDGDDAQRISQLCWMFFLKIIDDQDQEFEVTKSSYRSPIPRKLQWRSWGADPEGITGDELLNFVNGDLFPGLKGLPVASAAGDRCRVVRDVFEDAYNYMKSGQPMRQVVNKINEVDFNDLTERQHFGDIYGRCSTICKAPATRANITLPALSPPSWSTASTHGPARPCSILPAARAVFSRTFSS
jgi:type I restriction enzyme M protein